MNAPIPPLPPAMLRPCPHGVTRGTYCWPCAGWCPRCGHGLADLDAHALCAGEALR